LRINPNKLVNMLNQVSIGGLIDPVKLTFGENNVQISQLDATRTLGIIAKIAKTQFGNYQSIGSVLINSEITKRLEKFFKSDETIDLTLSPQMLRASGSMETFEADLPSEEISELQTETINAEVGILLAKPEIRAAFYIDPNEIKTDYGERSKFVFSEKGLVMKIHENVFRYDRRIRALKHDVRDSGEVLLDTKILDKVRTLCKGPMWIVFSEGPVEICYKEVGFQATYIISPLMEE